MKSLRSEHGDVRFVLENLSFSSILYSIIEKELDVGITLETDVLKAPTIDSCVLTEIPRVLVYSKNYNLKNNTILEPMDFKDEWFLVPRTNRGSYINDLLNSFCEPYGFKPNVQEVRNTESLTNSVVNGLGVAVVDYFTYESLKKHCHCIVLESTATIAAMWRKDNTNILIKSFIQELQHSLENFEIK
ncbi:MAG: LysR family transcriptional regulator substrate-binding protein [Lachnospirales bacterium]